MKAAKKGEASPITLPRLNLQHLELTLVGDSALICHAWSVKAKKQMLDKQMKRAKTAKEAKDPKKDFAESLYRHPSGGFGFPAVALKAAAVDACSHVDGITKVEARGAFHIDGELVKITGKPAPREDMVRVGMGTADIRYRGEFKKWSTKFTERFERGTDREPFQHRRIRHRHRRMATAAQRFLRPLPCRQTGRADMSKMVFEWTDGFRGSGRIKAQIAGEALERIRRLNRGVLTAESVVRDARSAKAALHKYFEWDDTKAGAMYREDQARELIRSVRVVAPKKGKQDKRSLRAYVHVAIDDDDTGYVTASRAMSNTQMREQVLKNALGELRAWQKRYTELQELAKVFSAIDAVERGIERSGQRLLKAA